MLTVPEITVICSDVGCVCGGTLYPAGFCNRAVNSPFFFGSPASTASFAPGGNPGGASPHFKSAGLTTTCCSFVVDSVNFLDVSFFCAATAASESTKGRASINAIFFIVFLSWLNNGYQFPASAQFRGRLPSAATILPKINAGDPL